jgi:hypothetical protein
MQLDELLVEPRQHNLSDDESDDITLTQYSDDDVIPDELRELSELLVGVESAVQARMILAFYFPELEWGGQEV